MVNAMPVPAAAAAAGAAAAAKKEEPLEADVVDADVAGGGAAAAAEAAVLVADNHGGVTGEAVAEEETEEHNVTATTGATEVPEEKEPPSRRRTAGSTVPTKDGATTVTAPTSVAVGAAAAAATPGDNNHKNPRQRSTPLVLAHRKKKKAFVKKTKKRVVDSSQKLPEFLEATVVVVENGVQEQQEQEEEKTTTTTTKTTYNYKVTLVVSGCQFPSGRPVVLSPSSSSSNSRRRLNLPKPPKQTSAADGEAQVDSENRTMNHDDVDMTDKDGPEDNVENPQVASAGGGGKKRPLAADATAAELAVPITGHDGNYHYCTVCNQPGNVVCCDGCPQVYHPECMPANEPARINLDKDNNSSGGGDGEYDGAPWFCPDCCAHQEGRPLPKWRKKQQQLAEATAVATATAIGKANPTGRRGRAVVVVAAAGGGGTKGGRGKGGRGRNTSRRGGSLPLTQQQQQQQQSQRNTATAAASSSSSRRSTSPTLPPSTPTRKSSMRNAKRFAPNRDNTKGGEDDDDEMTDVEANGHESDAEDYPDDELDETNATSMALSADDMDDGDSVESPPLSPNPAAGGGSATKLAAKRRRGRRKETKLGSVESPVPEQERRNRGRSRKDSEDTLDEDGPSESSASRKQGRLTSTIWTSQQAQEHHDRNEKRMKRKEKKQLNTGTAEASAATSSSPTSPTATPSVAEVAVYSPAASGPASKPKSTPAFFFFMNENRSKIERALARKHRTFNRLPKGMERNALITKEAATWWTKLKEPEMKRYMDMSMQQYEQRIIAWKEEKNLRAMMEGDTGDLGLTSGDSFDLSAADEELTYNNYQRLYRATNVGHKPFRPDPDESNNRILLELLQDMRFHPYPMLQAQRGDKDYGEMDFDRVTIPYFDVHGPVATSLGDECLGCARGWTHFCHVLKRRIPAVEQRAKLQPPLSSLVATRVGLGMKQGISQPSEETNRVTANKGGDEDDDSLGDGVGVFTRRQLPEIEDAKKLPLATWESLSSPSLRSDDIVNFIEEVSHMKVPDPPVPCAPGGQPQQERKKKKVQRRVSLPLGRSRSIGSSADGGEDGDNDGEGGIVAHKCGRCRTVIQGDTGCIPCRRAQLVINLAKGGIQGGNRNGVADAAEKVVLLQVQTHMLGRVNLKDSSGEVQSESDVAVANHMLRQRWTPFTVLPPNALQSPIYKGRKRPCSEMEGSDEARESPLNEKEKPEVWHNVNRPFKPTTKPFTAGAVGAVSGDSADSDGSTRSSPSSDVVPSDLNRTFESLASDTGVRKRLRTRTKPTGGGRTSPDFEETDRQELAQKLKELASELQKRMVSVACYGIYLALVRRDPLLLFAEPAQAEGYSAIIKRPMDFGKIRSNMLAGRYTSLGAFVADVRLLCYNALYFNPPGSLYAKTAQALLDILAAMHKRASNWMTTLKDAQATAWRKSHEDGSATNIDETDSAEGKLTMEDLLRNVRREWPEAVEMLESEDSLRKTAELDFKRTKENEVAYYGAIAVRRAALAAGLSLVPYPDAGGVFNPVSKRSYLEDEKLRNLIAKKVAESTFTPQLKDIPTWREDSIMRILRRSQNRRLEGMSDSLDGCARVDGVDGSDETQKIAMSAEALGVGRKRKLTDAQRVDKSRMSLTTGVGSQKLREAVHERREEAKQQKGGIPNVSLDKAGDVDVTVRGSRVHGWGLFADQPFNKGDFVAEYIGEYVSPAVTDAREKVYRDRRIQDYQFRLDHTLVIDATMRGGHGRYINHSCNPNCVARIVPGETPNEHLKRVIILADRNIEPLEELSYDYQFPLEEDLAARIPCNCQADLCRGFMNWDLPEKGSSFQDFRTQKRGANMRDRIRRLGRPLKGDNK